LNARFSLIGAGPQGNCALALNWVGVCVTIILE
jgi:hypothetical protein